MKSKFLKALILAAACSVSLERAGAQALDLSAYTTGSAGFYTNTFDKLGYSTSQTNADGSSGYLSGEWTCYINATVNSYGTIAAGAPNVSSPGTINNWTNPFTGGFFNYASYFDYIGGTNFYTNNALPGFGTNLYGVITNLDYQTNEPNRCLGIRQIGSFGDPGAAFVIKLANTLAYDSFALSLDWMNLDPISVRQTTWQIQYGVADPVVGVPAAFQNIPGLGSVPLANAPGSFHFTRTHFTIPNGTINNIDGQVWLRIVALQSSSSSGNRETFAIDNFGLTWQSGTAGCTPATGVVSITAPSPPVYSNATASFQVSAAGSQPLFYQWRYNNQNVEQAFPSQIVGNSYRSSTLSLQNVTPDNNGTYDCVISNVCGGIVYTNVSPTAVLSVASVPVVSLGFLRTLTDTNAYAPTVPVSQLYQATGIITTVTNTTTGDTSSYYIQDATGGMNLFVTGGSAFRPNLGDEVTVVGFLNGFQGGLEIEADLNDATHQSGSPATSVQVLSNNIANYPVAKVLDWPTEFAVGVTNRTVEQGTTNGLGQIIVPSKKGSICLLRDVYFGTNAGVVITGNYYAYVTNAAGLGGYVYFWGGQDQDVVSNTIPAFAYSVQGPLIANVVSGGGSFWSGVGVSKWSDVVTTPLIVRASWVANAPQLTWTAVPQTYTYSVLAASTLNGPFTPIATGLTFPDANGAYTDLSASGQQKFYRITSP